MAMKRSTLWGVLCVSIIMLVVSSHVSHVHCRVLRSETLSTEEAPHDCSEMEASSETPLGMASFPVSSNNFSTRTSLRSLTFLLASGPSKKGPGH